MRLRLPFARRGRVTPVLQLSETDCGPACLAMILNHHGLELPLSEVTDYFGVGRDGVSALDLARAAEHFGLQVMALSLRHSDFSEIALPAIVHWNADHYVIIESSSKRWVDIVDPAYGRRRLSLADFEESFSHLVLTFRPGTSFVPRRSSRSIAYREYFRPILNSPRLLAGILAASLLLQVLGLSMPLFTAVVVDNVLPGANSSFLNWLGLGMLLILLGQGLASYCRSHLLVKLQIQADQAFMLGFFRHLQSLPFSFFQSRSTGDLLERFASNIAIREALSHDSISLVLDCTLATGYLVLLLFKAPLFAGAVALVAIVQAVLLWATHTRTRMLEDAVLHARGKSSAYLLEAVAGIATLKSAGAEDRSVGHWTTLFQKQLSVTAYRERFEATVGAALTLLRALAPLVLLWLGAQRVLEGQMTLGTMLAANGLALGVLVPVGSILPNLQKFHVTMAHLHRILDVLTRPPEQDPKTVVSPPAISGRIEVNDVSFRYAANAPWALRNINIRIEAGQKVAIVGKTGSGKSTLAKLLVGLYVPTEGEILYDGIPLRGLNLTELRRQFGIVLQDSYIFGGSIRSNIALNDPDMPLEQVRTAAEQAALTQDIERMPMGFATYVAEAGSALSGGQRQRLAIARAIAHRPKVVLLDEATSHLDSVTEQFVDRGFSDLRCTRVVIAHRLCTVRDADLILVMDQGAIVEQGTHAELLARGGFYSCLVAAQEGPKGSEPLELVA